MLYAKTLSDSTTTIGQAKGWFLDSSDSQQIVIAENNRLTLLDDKCNVLSSMYSYKTIDTISTVWGFEGFNDLLFWLSTDLSFGLLTFTENNVRTIHEGHIIDYVGSDFPFRVSRRQLLVTGTGDERMIFASVFEASNRSNLYSLLVFKISNVVTDRVTTGSQLFVNIDVSIVNIPLPRPASNFIDFCEIGNRGSCPKLALLLRHGEECSAFSFIFGEKSLEIDDIQCYSVPNDSMLIKAVEERVWVIAPSGIVCLTDTDKCYIVAKGCGRPMATCIIKGDGLLLIGYEDGSIWAIHSDSSVRVGWCGTAVRLPHAHFMTFLKGSGVLLLGSRTSNSVAVRLSRCHQRRIKMTLFKERVKSNNGPVVDAKILRASGSERDLIVTANSSASDGSINIGHVGLAVESNYERRTFPGNCEIFSALNYLLLTTNTSSTIKEIVSSTPYIVNQRPSPSPHRTLYFGCIDDFIVQVSLERTFLLDQDLNILDMINNSPNLLNAKVSGNKHFLVTKYEDHVEVFNVINSKWAVFDRLNKSVTAATILDNRLVYADSTNNSINNGTTIYQMGCKILQMIAKNNSILMAMEDGTIQIRGEYTYSSTPSNTEVKIYDMDTFILITFDGRPFIWDPKIKSIRPVACSREIHSAALFNIPTIPNTLSKIQAKSYPSFYAIYVDSWHSLELTRVKCEVSVDWKHQFVGGTPVFLEIQNDVIVVLVESKEALQIKSYDSNLVAIDSIAVSTSYAPVALVSIPYKQRNIFAVVYNDSRYKSFVMFFEASDDSIEILTTFPLRNAFSASKGRDGELIVSCENEILILAINSTDDKISVNISQNIPFVEPIVFSGMSSECKTSLCAFQQKSCEISSKDGANLVVLVQFAASCWFMKLVDKKWILINPNNSTMACPHPVAAVAYPPEMMWCASWTRELSCIDCSNETLKPIASCKLRHMIMFMTHFNPRITEEDSSFKTDLLCISTSGALVLLTPLPSKSHFLLLKQVQSALDKTFQLQAYSQFTVGNWPHRECFSGTNILDADFIEEFERLDMNIRENITKSVNAKTELILKCLADVDQMIV